MNEFCVRRLVIGLIALGLGTGCRPSGPAEAPSLGVEDVVQGGLAEPLSTGKNLLGSPLRAPGWSPEARARLEEDLAIALAQFQVAPDREDSYIWVGRRLGYLARWDEAIAVFSKGIEVHPDSYRLYRFRGRHRARGRQLELAVEDYRKADDLISGHEDAYEPDGAPNARNKFLGSDRGNIHYYLGQTSYALGDYATTLERMTLSSQEPLVQTPDHQIATLYWRYLALRKLGRHEEAVDLVREVPEGLEMLENQAYYDGVRLFQGSVEASALIEGGDVVARFAVAMLHHFNDEADEAMRLWVDIVEGSPQGFWPAEAEILRAGN